MSLFKILVINPGSTSTKIAVFENEKQVSLKKVEHSATELGKYAKLIDQYYFRRQVLFDFFKEKGFSPKEFSAVVGRGGFIKAVPSGVFKVCPRMFEDLNTAKYGEHASNLGAILAYGFEWEYKIPAYIVDPVVVDEMNDIARLSGLKEIERRSIWHALNIMAVVRQASKMEGLDFRRENFVVAHMGGGISVAAIEKGRCIDVSNGLESGPYTPERSGTLPSLELVKLCFSGKYKFEEVKKMIVGKGGLVSYLGTSDLREVERRIDEGDDYAKLVYYGMGYQVAKEIGSYVAVLKGKVSRIILTGGAARGVSLVNLIKEYVEAFAPVVVIPGEDELAALALGGLRVLRGEEKALNYNDFV